MTTIPEEERVTVKDQDMSLSLPHIERALGVEWCITSDTFKFRVQVKANLLTRRGVLSTVASIYDPLGFIAPFVLLGKQILQQMCREKVDWDEEIPEHLKPQWESWTKDFPGLADVQINRCFVPSDFGQVKSYELHHFADAMHLRIWQMYLSASHKPTRSSPLLLTNGQIKSYTQQRPDYPKT